EERRYSSAEISHENSSSRSPRGPDQSPARQLYGSANAYRFRARGPQSGVSQGEAHLCSRHAVPEKRRNARAGQSADDRRRQARSEGRVQQLGGSSTGSGREAQTLRKPG